MAPVESLPIFEDVESGGCEATARISEEIAAAGEGWADNEEMENEAVLWERIEGEQLAAIHEREDSAPVVFAESTGKRNPQAPG